MTTRERAPIIDCDIHQTTRGPKDLFPYLSRAYQERIELFGTGLSQRVGYPNVSPWGPRTAIMAPIRPEGMLDQIDQLAADIVPAFHRRAGCAGRRSSPPVTVR